MRFSSRVFAFAALTVAASCGGGGSDSSAGATGPTTPQTPVVPSSPATPVITTAVSIEDDFFNPANIQVSPGQTVTWTWSTSTTHNVTFSDSGSGDKGGENVTFSKTFPTAGTFNYNCTLHGGMTGTVLVK